MAKRKKSKGKSRGKSRGKSKGKSRGKSHGLTKAARSRAAKKGWATRRSRGMSWAGRALASIGLGRRPSHDRKASPRHVPEKFLIIRENGQFWTGPRSNGWSNEYANAHLMSNSTAADKTAAKVSGKGMHRARAKHASLYR